MRLIMAMKLASHSVISESMEFHIKLATVFFIALIAVLFRRGRNRKLPPGPFPLPIIGNLHLLGELPHRTLAALSMKYGPLMSLRLGSVLTLVVSSPEIAKDFLKTHDRLFATRPPTAASKHLTYNFSDLAFAPHGPYWRQMRKLCVLQLLSSKRLDGFRSIREEEAYAMIRSIIISSNGSHPLNITKAVSALSSSIICRMAFGRKYSEEDSRGFNSMIKEVFLLVGSFNVGDCIPYLAWMDLQGLNSRLKRIQKTLDDFLEKVIDEHAAQSDPTVQRDLVDVLLAASADKDAEFQPTRDNIKAVLFDMLAAGTDTSSASIEWAMSEVLRNPPVLKKLQDELERVVGLGRMVCESDLPHLIYLQAVVKESLRLHPEGPILFRQLSMEGCNVLGYDIPPHTHVLVNVWAIERNPSSWKDPEIFKPERFMHEGAVASLDAKIQNFEWLAFGGGRRGCPGQQLGTLVVELALAQLLHCFTWRLPLYDMNGQKQELDMTERYNGLTLPRVHELFAIPTPRLLGKQ